MKGIKIWNSEVNKKDTYLDFKGTLDFAEKVMWQHYIISYGDNTELIKNFCKIAGVEVI